MGKCRYDLSEYCNNTDCLECTLDKIRTEIEQTARYCEEYKDYGRVYGLQIANDIIEKYRK